MDLYIYIYIYILDTYRHDDKVAGINDARRKTQEDAGRLLYKIFYLSSLFVSFERVVQSLRVRGSWRSNITEIFLTLKLWPSALCLSRSPWLLIRSTGFPYYISSYSATNYTVCLNSTHFCPAHRTQLSSVQFVGLILPSNSHAVIWTRFRNFFRYLATGMCHFR